MVFGIVLGVCIVKKGGATNKLPSINALYALFAAYKYDEFSHPYTYNYITQSKPSYPSKIPHLVLIIDESVRYDFSSFRRISLSKNKQANAQWYVYDFKLATSGANCSASSNIILRKNAQKDNLKSDLYNNALIWSYAKNAGYATYLYDAQHLGVGHDYFDAKESELIDHNISQKISDDSKILDAFSYLNKKEKSFSIIIKIGSHFPYKANYPKDFNIASPDFYVQESRFHQNYLNSVAYQSDRFFTKLFTKHFKEPVMIIYTSDHGQNLKDTQGLTHCSSDKIPYIGEGLVPLVVITNFFSLSLEQAQKINANKTSHFNIMPTFLSQMGFQTQGSLFEAISKPMNGFFYGGVFGYFGSEAPYASYKEVSLPDGIKTHRFDTQ